MAEGGRLRVRAPAPGAWPAGAFPEPGTGPGTGPKEPVPGSVAKESSIPASLLSTGRFSLQRTICTIWALNDPTPCNWKV